MINQLDWKVYPKSEWADLYCDYLNNFLTSARFASYYGMNEKHAQAIINMGRKTDNYSKNWKY